MARTGFVVAAFVTTVSAATGASALAIGPNEQCATVSADRAFTDGRPHLWQSSTNYGTTGCTNAYVVDVTYSALSPLPGTYLSWGDDEPETEVACRQSALRMFVWDLSGAQPAYRGTASSQGIWLTNDDAIRNPGATKLCTVPSVRAEAAFQLAIGRKYRFALRAERGSENQGLVFANAPVPSRKGNDAAGSASEGMFLAIPATPPERDASGWPVSLLAVKLESPDRRVARGGDLAFSGAGFIKLSDGYGFAKSPNFGYSNAMLLYQGNVGGLGDISCPAYALTATARTYNYSPGWQQQVTTPGSRYCLLSERNDRIYKLRVFASDAARSLILVGYLPASETGRRAWGCMDGICDDEVRVATQYTQPTQAERTNFVGTTLELLRATRSCLDSYLKRPLPVPLSMVVHGELSAAVTALTYNYGLGGPEVKTSGFEGLIRPGQTRVIEPLDLRREVHEPMHVYNHYFFADQLPSWLDEGYAIQAEVNSVCGIDPRLFAGGWYGWHAGDTDGHSVGSELFKRLSMSYGCAGDCAAEIWRDLVDALGEDRYLTNAEIKAVFEKRLRADLSPLFTTLGIDYERSWLVPSAARMAGQGGSFYTTDLTIANRTAADATVTLKFLGHDADGQGGAERTVTVGAGRAVAFDDVLGTQFAVVSGYGAIRVRSSAQLTVLGETWTPGPWGGTFGQSVPAMADDDLIDGRSPRSIVGVREDSSFRTNLMLANASPTSLLTNVALLDSNGVELARKSYTLPPLGMTQVTRVVRDLGVATDVRNGVLLVTTARLDAAFAAYASVIDRTTNDPRTLLPRLAEPGGEWILPSSARSGGQGGAFYTTKLTMANRGATDARATLAFLGHDVDGRGGAQEVVDIAAGRVVAYEDVLAGAFGLPSGYGAIRISSPNASLDVVGETSTPGPSGGTFGQSVPASAEVDLLRAGSVGSIVAIREDAEFRTNLILANATGASLIVDVELLSEAGAQLAAGSYALPPLGMRQVTQVIRDLGVSTDVRNAQLLLSTAAPAGGFAAYATVIDRTTNDPRTLLPR